MKFSELTKCPFCGGDEFYTKEYAFGTVEIAIRFDGEEADNGGAYDNLRHKGTGACYCRLCHTYLGNLERDTVSKKAEKVLKGGGQ